MSFYGSKTLRGKFTAHKFEIEANGGNRYGGVHAQIAYDTVTGAAIEVVLHHSGVNVVNAGENAVATLLLSGVNLDTPAQFNNLQVIDVATDLVLDADTHAILLEGTADVGGTLLDANADLHIVEPGNTLTGACKLVTFNYVQA